MGVSVVVTSNLADLTDRLKARIAEVATVLEEEMAEAGIRFSDRLIGRAQSTYHDGKREVLKGSLKLDAPGNGLWPVGRRKGESYLAPDDPVLPAGYKNSGRSLRGWKIRYRDGVLRAKNTARDRKRNRYAKHVHFSGKASGDAVKDASKAWREEADDASKRIRERLGELLGG